MASPPPPSSPIDTLFLQTLMSRLQLRPPFLDTNSFLTQTLDDFLLHGAGDDSDDPDDDDDDDGGAASAAGSKEERNRRALAKEEAKLEREIIRIVHSGDFLEALKPNSGQSVSIGDHNICVGFHEDPGSEYRVWEWHGHVMLFDEEEGYSAEYIYGNYFERLAGKKGGSRGKKDERGGNLGLRDLIGGSGNSVGNGGGRVLHRNSIR
ncbi:hypothetical protein ACMD2_08526 [Ananas comosus]|uniref:Uncharacterized protein n=1 Tax=Ananas comosus TaxID=4615 RepID=A0A199UUK7_ANACO|nr:hypothetical protein ACMD2_08526 [Ananas comosus]